MTMGWDNGELAAELFNERHDMTTPKAHAEYAASSSERWVNCPASLLLSKDAPEQKSGAAAEEGTLAHSLMEEALLSGANSVYEFENNPCVDLTDHYPTDMIKHVDGFVRYVRGQMKKGFELLVEERVYLDFIHPTEAFGTVDVAIIEPFGVLHIIDFKYGQGYVNHRDNTQMMYYALGIAHKLQYDVEEVRTTIYQPRGANETDPNKIARTDSFSVEKLKNFSKVLKTAVDVAEKIKKSGKYKPEHLNAGSWCKFCPAKIVCPQITKSALETAKLDFSSVVQPSPKSLTSDQVKAILDRSAYLELWIKEVKKYAEEQIRAGKKIAGWGLVPTKPQRVWRDEWTVKMITRNFPDLVKKELVTPAQAEKILKKKVTENFAKEFMNENVVTVSSGEKLQTTNNDYEADGLDDLSFDKETDNGY